MRPKHLWLVIIIALSISAFIFLLAITSITISLSKPVINYQSLTNQSTSRINTANWKTYRNEEFGFELKYPSDWKIQKDRGTVYFIDPVSFALRERGAEVLPTFIFSIVDNTLNLPLEDWIRNVGLKRDLPPTDLTQKWIVIGNYQWYIYCDMSMYGMGNYDCMTAAIKSSNYQTNHSFTLS